MINTIPHSRKRSAAALTLIAALAITVTGCSSKRQIDVEETGSTRVEGTSWYRFCDGPNAFIWVPSYTDSEPDELEAVIYDHWACVSETVPADGTDPRTDDDGIVEDDEQ